MRVVACRVRDGDVLEWGVGRHWPIAGRRGRHVAEGALGGSPAEGADRRAEVGALCGDQKVILGWFRSPSPGAPGRRHDLAQVAEQIAWFPAEEPFSGCGSVSPS